MSKPERIFGHIPGVEVGATFDSYAQMNAVGVHRQTQAGISGSGTEGADSIIVSGGYEDDQDLGNLIIYTGQGGQNSSGVHIADQTMERGNLALAKSELEGMPVRVIRGAHARNPNAPKKGYRYDGLYRVDSHWHERGRSGYLVWRYRLLKIDGSETVSDSEVATLPNGGNTNPSRKNSQVQRIVRDTKVAKKLKVHYDFVCQVCGIKINTAGGPYAEAAHIRPLGAPHNGPDTSDNILCLCPNHHVMFDLGAFAIASDLKLLGIDGQLNLSSSHQISLDHIAYHRNHYLSKLE